MSQRIMVIGAGIGGLTAAAVLARRGHRVTVLEQAAVPGGCASTFRRRGFTFDVGATQVAGWEPGGIHYRIFQELGVELPTATLCDPACAVFLPGETEPISVWHDRARWQAERSRQFPGSERFWQLMDTLFAMSWRFQGRDPVLPARSLWDWGQLIQALRPDTLLTVPFARLTVGDVLNLLGLGRDRRLRQFLDLQLKLYSQVDASETAVLYAATALGISQAPQGLYHLHGSMQVLSDRLVEALEKHGGELHLRHRVKEITHQDGQVKSVTVYDAQTKTVKTLSADQVVANVTTHNLINLLDPLPERQTAPPAWIAPASFLNWGQYRDRVQSLPPPSGAFVAYLGVKNGAIPPHCPPHLQFAYVPPPLTASPQEAREFAHSPSPQGEGFKERANDVNIPSLFVSVSRPGDGRAPEGCATVIASCFVDPEPWFAANTDEYTRKKAVYLADAIAKLSSYFHLTPDNIVHQEAATPHTFAHYTARERGFVGGVSQRLDTFGPFGFGTRTPIENLWLVGDSTHPGEGTAGVSYSALMAVRQIEQSEQWVG